MKMDAPTYMMKHFNFIYKLDFWIMVIILVIVLIIVSINNFKINKCYKILEKKEGYAFVRRPVQVVSGTRVGGREEEITTKNIGAKTVNDSQHIILNKLKTKALH